MHQLLVSMWKRVSRAIHTRSCNYINITVITLGEFTLVNNTAGMCCTLQLCQQLTISSIGRDK